MYQRMYQERDLKLLIIRIMGCGFVLYAQWLCFLHPGLYHEINVRFGTAESSMCMKRQAGIKLL